MNIIKPGNRLSGHIDKALNVGDININIDNKRNVDLSISLNRNLRQW